MSKVIIIKLTSSSPAAGPFTIVDLYENIIASDVTKDQLIAGVSYTVDDSVDQITIESTGKCLLKKTINVSTITVEELVNAVYIETKTASLWRHLTNISTVYNTFYGNTEPYIIEYPFAYQYYDQILQNVKDYTKAFKYPQDGTGVFSYNDKIEVSEWFNKAVVYNGQQSSGILELVAKPMHNLRAYLSYPKFNTDSKTITYTKSDNFYQYNSFWNIVKNKGIPLFITSCESLSIDKLVNQVNMDYGTRSFKKDPLRAKELKVRHILDNKSDVSLVSQFIYTPSQISFK
jgi:hypothetical protein